MRLKFRPDKATQVASTLIERCGGKVSVLKLVKLMYLVERGGLENFGRPVFCDSYYNMQHGPVVSRSLNLINSDATPDDAVIWDQYISERNDHSVSLRDQVNFSSLSRAESGVVDNVFEQFGHMSEWELRDYTHRLPEWEDPAGTSIPLSHKQILLALGKSEEEIEAIASELEAVALSQQVFG